MKEEPRPQLIKMNPLEIKTAIKEITDNFGRSIVVEQHSEKSSLRLLQLPGHNYYFVYSDKVDYFVRVRKVDLGQYGRPSRQVLVWRDKKSLNQHTVKVASHVFWDILYPTTNLVSDSQQTDEGRAFWQYAIHHALETGQWVDLINTADWSHVTIDSKEYLDASIPKAWGTSSFFQRYVFLIHKPIAS